MKKHNISIIFQWVFLDKNETNGNSICFFISKLLSPLKFQYRCLKLCSDFSKVRALYELQLFNNITNTLSGDFWVIKLNSLTLLTETKSETMRGIWKINQPCLGLNNILKSDLPTFL